jgi:hypothetical protein
MQLRRRLRGNMSQNNHQIFDSNNLGILFSNNLYIVTKEHYWNTEEVIKDPSRHLYTSNKFSDVCDFIKDNLYKNEQKLPNYVYSILPKDQVLEFTRLFKGNYGSLGAAFRENYCFWTSILRPWSLCQHKPNSYSVGLYYTTELDKVKNQIFDSELRYSFLVNKFYMPDEFKVIKSTELHSIADLKNRTVPLPEDEVLVRQINEPLENIFVH